MIRLLFLCIKGVKAVFLWLIKMKNKKATQLPGWAYVIALIIGLFVIVLIIWITAKSGGKMKGFLDMFKGVLGI